MAQAFNDFLGTVDITFAISETSVVFLDLELSISDHKISSKIHYKPTDSHSYLRYDSYHPQLCKDNIPFSQFLRLRRNCSKDEDFRKESGHMVDFFINRGYPTHIVHKARGRAASIDRQTSLGSGDSATNSTKLPLVLPFDHINRKVSAIIHKNAKILSEDESIGSIFDGNIITAYKRTSNLKDLFVRSRISQAVIPGTFPCGRARCVTCPHIHHTTEIVGPSGSTQIKDSFSCTSKNVVYVIVCLKCGELYVGETGRMLAERFREHLGDVRHARPNKEVAAHFNLPGHSLDDISVTGVLTRSEMSQRRLLETKLIRRLGTLLPQGMNQEED